MTFRRDWAKEIYLDPPWAHHHFFGHRHTDTTPVFHSEIITAWHKAEIARLLVLAFRQGAKSTIGEEAVILQACLENIRNCVILGENQERACDRLTAIKHELTTNKELMKVFGDLQGDVWGHARIILRNGVVIQALGRGQEVRGMKHLDQRPDLLFGDDLEAKEHVHTPEARHETKQWFYSEVLPALDKWARVRVLATPLDRESLPMVLQGDKRWQTIKVPIKFKDQQTGEWKATWPSRYPMKDIDDKEQELIERGLSHDFAREYMCEPEDPSKKIFTADMLVVKPDVHVWQSCYAFYDPARTTNERSATTGWAVWSWVGGSKLTVWDAGAAMWKPDELVKHIFEINRIYRPIEIGVEEDGLNEFLKQPIRVEMLRRGVILPFRPMKAPAGKYSFIEGLQPFFSNKDVSFAKPLPELQAQLLGYPSGNIDAPNALAYALPMRPGVPIYEDFVHYHVVERPVLWDDPPLWLAFNASPQYTTAALVQLCNGALHVLADWVREGDPGVNVKDIWTDARLEIGDRNLRCVVGRGHFTGYDTVGLRPAIGRIPADVIQGGFIDEGRAEIRKLLTRNIKGIPAVQIGHAARWTINAFASGYARPVNKNGRIDPMPADNWYRVLMEGIEGMAGLIALGAAEDDSHENWAYTKTGVPYKTILPVGGRTETKSDWLRRPPPDRIVDVDQLPKSLVRPPRG